MSSSSQTSGPIRFGVYEVDLPGRTLRKSGVRIRMQEKPFRLLAMLLARPGEVVTREELQQQLWPAEEYGEFDLGLNTAVKKLRQALGDSAESPHWIETVPKLGYRFVGNIGGSSSSQASDVAGGHRSRPPLAILAGGVILGAICLALGWFLGQGHQGFPSSRFHLQIGAPPGVAYVAFALSPDGTRVAFIGEGTGSPRLWVQSLVDNTVQEVEGSENADPAGTPFWSPDGQRIGFFAEGKLKRVPASGGTVQTICDAPFGRGGTWNNADTIVFAPRTNGDLWIVDVSTGSCEALLVKKPDESSTRSPQFLPGGERLLFTRRYVGRGVALGIASLNPARDWVAAEGLEHATYVESPLTGQGHLFYVREGSLWARRFNSSDATIDGPEREVAQGVGFDSMTGRGLFDVSPRGVLVYLPEGAQSRQREIGWFTREGKNTGKIAEAETFGFGLNMSPDGRWAVLWQGAFFTGSPHNVHRLDLTTGISTGIANGTVPSISARGDRIFYTSDEGLVMAPAAGGKPQTIVKAGVDESGSLANHRKFFCDFNERTGVVVFQQLVSETGWDIWTTSLQGDEPQPFLEESFDEGHAQFSPDGRWCAYVSDESGRREVYVRGFPSSDHKSQISYDGGWLPRWRGDGSELFYVDTKGMLTAVAIQADGDGIRAQRPVPLFPVSTTYSNVQVYGFAPRYTYDVSEDGQRFLAFWRPPDMPFPPLQVITNWEIGDSPRTH